MRRRIVFFGHLSPLSTNAEALRDVATPAEKLLQLVAEQTLTTGRQPNQDDDELCSIVRQRQTRLICHTRLIHIVRLDRDGRCVE